MSKSMLVKKQTPFITHREFFRTYQWNDYLVLAYFPERELAISKYQLMAIIVIFCLNWSLVCVQTLFCFILFYFIHMGNHVNWPKGLEKHILYIKEEEMHELLVWIQ